MHNGNKLSSSFKDGEIIAAVEEERLSRIKNDNTFPHNAIKEVLEIGNLDISRIDVIAIYWRPWKLWTRSIGSIKKIINSNSSRKFIFNRIKEISNPSEATGEGSWRDLFFLKNLLEKKHGKVNARFMFIDHHLTHQRYGESINNWDECISLSYDGGGESYSTVLTSYINGEKKILSKHKWPNSLGHFYSFFTGFLGFKMLEGEYKMMGLAPYGEPIWTDLILEKILILKNNGKYEFNTKLCDYHAALKGVFDPYLEKLFCKRRTDNLEPNKNQINLATSVQKAFEKALIHVLRPGMLANPEVKKLVITGGCALNVTANGKLLSSKIFDEIIIPPAPHDAGCAIGAVLCALDKLKIPINYKSVSSPYLGRKYSDDEINKFILEACNYLPKAYDDENLINETAKLLSEGNLIAWFQNESEFGPRALV